VVSVKFLAPQSDRTDRCQQRNAQIVMVEMPTADYDATFRGPMTEVQPVGNRPGDAEGSPEGRPGQQQRLLDRSYLVSVGSADPPPEHPQRGNAPASVVVTRRHRVPSSHACCCS
jgi:hypothetical protein